MVLNLNAWQYLISKLKENTANKLMNLSTSLLKSTRLIHYKISPFFDWGAPGCAPGEGRRNLLQAGLILVNFFKGLTERMTQIYLRECIFLWVWILSPFGCPKTVKLHATGCTSWRFKSLVTDLIHFNDIFSNFSSI